MEMKITTVYLDPNMIKEIKKTGNTLSGWIRKQFMVEGMVEKRKAELEKTIINLKHREEANTKRMQRLNQIYQRVEKKSKKCDKLIISIFNEDSEDNELKVLLESI